MQKPIKPKLKQKYFDMFLGKHWALPLADFGAVFSISVVHNHMSEKKGQGQLLP